MAVGRRKRIWKRLKEAAFDVEGVSHPGPDATVVSGEGDLAGPGVELDLEVIERVEGTQRQKLVSK